MVQSTAVVLGAAGVVFQGGGGTGQLKHGCCCSKVSRAEVVIFVCLAVVLWGLGVEWSWRGLNRGLSAAGCVLFIRGCLLGREALVCAEL